jgi:NAD+ kinase
LEAIRTGAHRVERRFTLEGCVHGAEGPREVPDRALNDVVLHKSAGVRIVTVRVSVDGELVGQYTADGMIIATPAGSTAYSLSAGGPVLLPDVDGMVVTAISPHTLRVRPVVVPGTAGVELEVCDPTDEALLAVDGQPTDTVRRGERVTVRRSRHCVNLIRLGTEGFFTRMRRKLEWGDLSERERNRGAD